LKNKTGKIKWRILLIILSIGCGFLFFLSNTGCCGQRLEKGKDIKLVVMVVIDQLRADMVSHLEHRFGEGGLKYLIDNGTWYKNARYEYVPTLTSVGHATLYTGAAPSEHGIIGNYWMDRETGEVVKTAEGPDPKDLSHIIPGPMKLIGTTIGDELSLAFNGKSRVFSISLKDRAAILPGGHLGKAFWYNNKTGEFQTGEYYYRTPPQWLDVWNKMKKADQYKNAAWELLHEKSTYIYGNSDDRPEEKPFNEPPKYNRSSVFPHSLAKYSGEEYYNQLCFTPFADDLTVDLALQLLREEKPGQGEYTDMLAVSLSVTDLVGHMYGPCSLEYEDNLLHVDAALARLFNGIDETVGLNRTLIVLAADHGVDLNPEYRKRLGMEAGRIDPEDFMKVINAALKKKFNLTEDRNFVAGFRNPSIYLDAEAVKTLNADIADVEAAAVEAVMGIRGIAFAVGRSDMLKGNLPDMPIIRKLRLSFHPTRSGNILLIQSPFWFLYHVHNEDTAMHGAPYSYDNHVPLFFAGPGIRHGEVFRLVRPRDVAATVALKLGIAAPSGSSGTPLLEIFQ
jgi:predicted AlkP superfamily pyrophosphatase or phosphodiesterase